MQDNIDPGEISKFSAMADYWWDRQGRLKALHDINPLRLHYIDARAPLAGATVLDVGCGGGILSEAMAASGASVTGIDMGAGPLSAAVAHMRTSGVSIRYKQATAEAFADAYPGAFDRVVCMELLEHVPSPQAVVSACARLVRPGGDVFFATLNRNVKSFLFVIVGAEYLLGMVEKGTHTYARFVKPCELTGWASCAGLRKMDLTGLHYNVLSRSYYLGGNAHVNYMMHFRRRDGATHGEWPEK